MAVYRIRDHKNYTIMSNTHLRDMRLSLKAKGLMSQMLSLPDNWDYTTAGLIAINREEERAIKSALAELKEAGYLVVTKLFPNETESGHIEYVYDLYEEPQNVENVDLQNQDLQNVGVQNAGQLNKDNQYTDKQNTDNKDKRIKRDSLEEILLENEPTASSEALRNSFIDFIKMRKLIKKPLTEKGLMLAINRAYSLAKGDVPTMIKIVDQSVLNSWQGLFELKEPTAEKRTTGGGSKANDALSQLQELAAEEGIEL